MIIHRTHYFFLLRLVGATQSKNIKKAKNCPKGFHLENFEIIENLNILQTTILKKMISSLR